MTDGDGNGDGQSHVCQNAKTILCWSSQRKSERWLQELRDRRRSGIPKMRERLLPHGQISQLRQCYTAPAQTLMAIQNVFDSSSDSDNDSCARGNGERLWNGDLEGRSTKYDVRHFLFVLLLRCDRLFAVKFHTMIVTVAVIFVIVKPPSLLFWERVRLVGCLCKQVFLLARMRGHEFL